MNASTVVLRPMIALVALSIALSACSGASQADLASASQSAAHAQEQKDAAAQQAKTQASLKAEVDKLKTAASQSASASKSSSAAGSSAAKLPTSSPSRSAAPKTTRTTHAVSPYVDPVAVVQKYYSDLNSKNFRAAWDAGGYNFTNGGSYNSWVAGYSDTTGVIGTATDIGGGVVSTQFSAVHVDGSVVRYAGTYTVRGAVIVAGHMHRVS